MTEYKHTMDELRQWQALPLSIKLRMTQERIRMWVREFGENDAFVSFSGGKDSTVLLDIVRKMYPSIKAVFVNTGLEYPEIQRFVKDHENVEIIAPKMNVREVVMKYGYPIISKEISSRMWFARKLKPTEGVYRSREAFLGAGRYVKGSRYNQEKYLPIAQEIPALISSNCCQVSKKSPVKRWQHENNASSPILATMAEESMLRTKGWMVTGCNNYEGEKKKSQPMSFWTEQDVLKYIVLNDLPICSVYGDIVTKDQDGLEYPANPVTIDCGRLECTGCKRTGCIFCGYGFHLDKGKTRFQRLAETHTRQYEFALGGGEWADNPFYDETAPKYDGEWKNWNPKKIWVPNQQGLGMRRVFEMVNEIMGKDFYRYE